jgi:hypothetical protein
MKKGKAPGVDGVTIEMLVAAGDKGIEIFTKLLNEIYSTGILPEELTRSIFIAIPKKPGATECELYRTISLMSHVTKILLRILMMRARSKIKPAIAQEQFGFKEDSGTRNAIFTLRMLGERAIEMQKDLYICFIDYQKAFDSIKHKQMMDILINLDMDENDIRMMKNMYWSQTAAIRVDGEMGKWVKIEKGTWQGSPFSPDQFNLYAEDIIKEIKEQEGIKVGGTNINNIRYADDAAALADSEQKLQGILDILVKESEKKGLKINIKKTVVMVMSKETKSKTCQLIINGERVKQVEGFSYLGSMITEDGRCEKEIRRRIGIAKQAFQNMKSILTNNHISKETRLRVLKCYVWSTLLYGCEAWTITKGMERKLEAAEMWFLRRMLKIRWVEKISNIEVLRKMGTTRNLMKSIRKRQLEFFGHVMRKGGLENIATTGKIEGKRARGRQRIKYLDSLGTSWKATKSPIEIIRATTERFIWKSMTVDAISGMTN